jgi:hypothetical protein
MEFKLNASRTIDILIEAMQDIGNYNKHEVQKAREKNDTNHISYLQKHEYNGQHTFWNIRDMLGCDGNSLCVAVHSALKWYKRTKWEICMSEKTAQSLLSAAISGKF